MPVMAIHANVFQYPRIREILYCESSDKHDVLEVVEGNKWLSPPMTTAQRKRMEAYFIDIRNTTDKNSLAAEIKSKLFRDAHEKATKDWQKIWTILIRKSNFNNQFAVELRKLEVDAVKQLADWEVQLSTLQDGGSVDPIPASKPTAGSLCASERERLHQWIFGKEGFHSVRTTHTPIARLLSFTEAAVQTAWDRDSNRRKAKIAKLNEVMEEIDASWASWGDPGILKLPMDLRKWVRSLQRTKELAAYLCNTSTQEKLEEYTNTVSHVLASKDESLFEAIGICTLPAEQIRRMAAMIDEAEYHAMSQLWGRFISNTDEEHAVHNVPSVSEEMMRQFLQTTMGVEQQLVLSSQELFLSMGATLSNDGQHHALGCLNYATPANGWYAWDASGHNREASFEAQLKANIHRQDGNPGDSGTVEGFVPLDHRWHQLCGIHSMLSHISAPCSIPIVEGQVHNRRGILISDEVGVGKTAQVIGLISQLIHWKHLQSTGRPLPPVHENAGGIGHFIFGEHIIPDAPHVIVAPVALIPNWEMELKTWIGRHAEVFVYDGSYDKHKNFFGPNGPFMRSKQLHNYRKILLTTPTALASDAKTLLVNREQLTPKGISKVISMAMDDAMENNSLLHRKEFGALVVDEAHEHRTGGARFEGLIFLRDRATVVVSATATPLYTGARDLRNMGRINNLSEFMTEDAELEEHDAARVTARVRKLQNLVRANKDGEEDEDLTTELREKLAEMLLDVGKIRRRFGHTIIRRELTSTGEGGAGTVTGMKPFWHQKAFLVLSSSETDNIKQIEDILAQDSDVVDDIHTINLLFESSGFYLRLRQASINAASVYATLSHTRPPKTYESLQDFEQRGSTKEKTVIAIIKHHIPLATRQKDPLTWSKTGGMTIEARACGLPEISRPGCTKYVVYTEFTSLMRYLQSALDLHALPYLLLTGESGNPKKRSDIIEKFQRGGDQDPAILLLSNVGKVGINLSAANILIVMDPLFSNQEFRQIVGRVWRYPQDRQVIIYQLVALGTADVTLQDIAENKDTLLNAFNSTESTTTRAILHDLLGECVDEVAAEMEDGEEDDAQEEGEEDDALYKAATHERESDTQATANTQKGKRKAATTRTKRKTTVATDEEATSKGTKGPRPKGRGSRHRKEERGDAEPAIPQKRPSRQAPTQSLVKVAQGPSKGKGKQRVDKTTGGEVDHGYRLPSMESSLDIAAEAQEGGNYDELYMGDEGTEVIPELVAITQSGTTNTASDVDYTVEGGYQDEGVENQHPGPEEDSDVGGEDDKEYYEGQDIIRFALQAGASATPSHASLSSEEQGVPPSQSDGTPEPLDMNDEFEHDEVVPMSQAVAGSAPSHVQQPGMQQRFQYAPGPVKKRSTAYQTNISHYGVTNDSDSGDQVPLKSLRASKKRKRDTALAQLKSSERPDELQESPRTSSEEVTSKKRPKTLVTLLDTSSNTKGSQRPKK